MTTGWGADPIKDGSGNVTVGTTAADIRQITGSLYSAGLISGGVVTRSPSALTYTVSNGVAAFPMTADLSSPYRPENQRTVLGPIPAKVLTTTAPSSGTRVDIIYAQQHTPADDSDANVVVEYGTTLPARAVLLNAFIVSAGNTNTNQTVRTMDVKYSIPYGASLGMLYNVRSTFNGAFTVRATDLSGTFFLPTDRLVRVSLMASLSASGATGFSNAHYCEAGYDIFIDGVKKYTWTSVGLHQAWAEHNWSDVIVLPAGTRTIRSERFRSIGPGTPVARATNYGALLSVEDIGPVP